MSETKDKTTPKETPKPKKAKQKAKKGSIIIPDYLTNPSKDPDVKTVQRADADDFFTGLGEYEKQGSCSAKVTYLGPHGVKSFPVLMGKREINPSKNNWKISVATPRFFRDTELGSPKDPDTTGLVKDADFIQSLLTSEGGKQNYKVRFINDPPFAPKKAKARDSVKDVTRILGLPARIRLDQLKMGIKVPLNQGEASKFLEVLKIEGIKEESKHVLKYLQEKISKEKKQAEEAAKRAAKKSED